MTPRIPFAVLVALICGCCALAHAQSNIPPGEPGAKAAIEKSPRHGEWVDVEVPGRSAPVRAYVVYPEVKDKAPVVIVIHEIFGLTDWVRSVADQLAADGFIAVAPDLLSGMGEGGKGTEGFTSRDDVTKAVRGLTPEQVKKDLDAVRAYGAKLPASNGKTATIGFCWGGSTSFRYSTETPELAAAVVYYGGAPEKPEAFEKMTAPVLGLYGSDDARVNKTIEPADQAIKKLGKSYTYHVYDGAGHGFLRQQDGKDGANLKASQQAWPATIEFLTKQTK